MCLLFILFLNKVIISGKSSVGVGVVTGHGLIFFLRSCITLQTTCKHVHEGAAVESYAESSLWLHTCHCSDFYIL